MIYMDEQAQRSSVGQNQINMTYDAAQDRILIRATESGKEYRAWWTRRLALRICKLFSEHSFPTENVATHLAADQQQELGAMEKQGAVQQADFATPFQVEVSHYPLGEQGVLIQRVDIKTEGKIVKFVLLPEEGEGMILALPPSQRYTFEHMLQKVMTAAQWISTEQIQTDIPDERVAH